MINHKINAKTVKATVMEYFGETSGNRKNLCSLIEEKTGWSIDESKHRIVRERNKFIRRFYREFIGSKTKKRQKGLSQYKNLKQREYAIRFFNRSKYTDNVTLTLIICKFMGWDNPKNAKDRSDVLIAFQKTPGKVKPKRMTEKSSDFYVSKAWKALRYLALCESNGCCCCCGQRPYDGFPLHVDHIKPRSKYPELELDLSNLQVMCGDCNYGKDNVDETDWREVWNAESESLVKMGIAPIY